MSLNVANLGTIENQPAALIGGMDGFVSAVDLKNGQVIRHQQVGAPVIGISFSTTDHLLITTRNGVLSLDQDWQPQHPLQRKLNRAHPLGENRLLVSHRNHTLELLELDNR